MIRRIVRRFFPALTLLILALLALLITFYSVGAAPSSQLYSSDFVRYWDFDDTYSGTGIPDSINGAELVPVGETGFGLSSTYGRPDNYLWIGPGGFTNSLSSTFSSLGVGSWVSLVDSNSILSLGVFDASDPFVLMIVNVSGYTCQALESGVVVGEATISIAVTTAVWHYAYCGFSGGNVVLYVDGTYSTSSYSPVLSSYSPTYLGVSVSGSSGVYFDGMFLYGVSLDFADFTWLYNADAGRTYAQIVSDYPTPTPTLTTTIAPSLTPTATVTPFAPVFMDVSALSQSDREEFANSVLIALVTCLPFLFLGRPLDSLPWLFIFFLSRFVNLLGIGVDNSLFGDWLKWYYFYIVYMIFWGVGFARSRFENLMRA